MSDHFTYLTNLIPDANWQKLAVAAAVGAALVGIGASCSARLQTANGIEQSVVPARKPSLFGIVDLFVEAFAKHQDSVLGKENRKYLPFTGSIFIFILISNLLGLVPGMPAATTTVWLNVAMALVVFIYFNYLGVKQHGLVGYLKHFCGPMLVLAPFLFSVEIFSTCLRILTLNLRLYWNIFADHQVLEVFTGLLYPPLPAVFYLLGTFVCFMQAFVFATLTMVYILLATQHEDHAEEGHAEASHVHEHHST